MKEFITRFKECQLKILSSFDRVLIKGHLPISHASGMENFLMSRGILLKDFKKYVCSQADRLKKFALNWANENNRPYIKLNGFSIRKEDDARRIAKEDNIKEGLVCVYSNVEGCNSFRLQYGKKGLRLINSKRKCLCLYFYIIDRVLGLLHVRIQTWFPFTIQICINGHEYLERQLCLNGVKYIKEENCFTEIEDIKKAQELSDGFQKLAWPELLSALANRFNPLLQDILSGMKYYWATDQAEYATDVIFENMEKFREDYDKLLSYSIQRFGAKDILKFFDKCSDGRFKGGQFNICHRRTEGARVRHWVKNNWIKMYNKRDCVLRIETVINNPYDFRIRRSGKKKGKIFYGWFPMAKRVGNLYRYAEISRTANGRYLDALAVQKDDKPTTEDMKVLSTSVKKNGRSYGTFNPAKRTDVLLMAVIMSAEYLIKGFKNADIRRVIFGETNNRKQRVRNAAKVSRLLKKLHVRGLIAKIPHSHCWRVTNKGSKIMGIILDWYNPLPEAA